MKTKKGKKLKHFLSLSPYTLAHIHPLTGGNTIAQPVALRSIEPSLGGRQQTVFPIVCSAHAHQPIPSDTEQLLSHSKLPVVTFNLSHLHSSHVLQLPVQVHHHRGHRSVNFGLISQPAIVCLLRGGQVLPAAPVHGQEVPAGARPHHRSRVRGSDDQH